MDEEYGRATFRNMTESTAEDWGIIALHQPAFHQGLPGRLIEHLRGLDRDAGGFAVSRLEHSLQTATRALRDGRDEEYVVCALLHDMGDLLLPASHAKLAAAVVQPYVSERNHFMVGHHDIFQGYYFFHYVGLDRNLRERFRGHPHFEYTAEFCELYDQAAFDGSYKSLPLEEFQPLLANVFEAPRHSPYFE